MKAQKLQAGRGKSVTLTANEIKTKAYIGSRDVLASLLCGHANARFSGRFFLRTLSHRRARFAFNYDGRHISIGCYRFGVRASRQLKNWALA